MAAGIKVEKEFYPAEDKFESDQHRYETPNDRYPRLPIGENLRSVHFYTHTQLGNELVFTVKGSSNNAEVRQNLIKHLAVAGLTVKEEVVRDQFSISSGEARKDNDFHLEIKRVGHDALIRAMQVFVQVREIELDVAGQIAEMERARLADSKISPVEAGLLAQEVDTMTVKRQREYGLAAPVSYMTATVNDPFSVVKYLREAGSYRSLGDQNVMEITTRIDVAKGSGERLVAALKEAGISAGKLIQNPDEDAIYAAAPADVVAVALKKAGLLSGLYADSVAEKAKSLHPDQVEINRDVQQAGRAAIRQAGLETEKAAAATVKKVPRPGR